MARQELDIDTVAVVFAIEHGRRRGPRFFSDMGDASAEVDDIIANGHRAALFTRTAPPRPVALLRFNQLGGVDAEPFPFAPATLSDVDDGAYDDVDDDPTAEAVAEAWLFGDTGEG